MSEAELLRESVRLEDEADLFAAALDLANANILLKRVNAIRAEVFGRFDPNELRRRTHECLAKDHK